MTNELDDYHYHEFLDRLHVIACLIKDHLEMHPVAGQHKDWRNRVQSANLILTNLYQDVGEIHIND